MDSNHRCHVGRICLICFYSTSIAGEYAYVLFDIASSGLSILRVSAIIQSVANASKTHTSSRLSIIIPAYNEERRIGNTLSELSAYLHETYGDKSAGIEVIVVVADSSDDTVKIVTSMGKKFLNFRLLEPGPPVGKGRDVQYGVLRASGEVIIFMDADLATPLYRLQEFYLTCTELNAIVIGDRNHKDSSKTLLRRLLSRIGNAYSRIVIGEHINDSQCGFKAFPAPLAKACFGKLSILGWGFDLEILAIACANAFQIRSISLPDWQDQPFSTYSNHLATNTLSIIWDGLRVSCRRHTNKYKVA